MKHRTQPLLLTGLALTALVGAVFVLYLTLSSGSPDASGDGHAARQRRAFLAVAPGAGEPHRSRPAEISVAEAARVQACRRSFWLGCDDKELSKLASDYSWARSAWAQTLVPQRGFFMSFIEPADGIASLPELRRKLNRLGEHPPALSLEIRRQWEEWEAKNWAGYALPSGMFKISIRPRRPEQAWDQRRNEAARSLLDQLEYLEDCSTLAANAAERSRAEKETQRVTEKLQRTLHGLSVQEEAEDAEFLERMRIEKPELFPPAAGQSGPN